MDNYNAVANQYFEKLLHCNHPIYDPSDLFETMEFNKTCSVVRGPMKWFNPKIGQEEAYHGATGSYTYDHDFHFFHCEANYEKLISMVTAVAMLTQF